MRPAIARADPADLVMLLVKGFAMFTIVVAAVLIEQLLSEVMPPGTLSELTGGWYPGADWFR